jgi:protein-lysine N-methyltransferase EEF2KMT
MNPAFNVYGTTLIVLAEWKPVVGRTTYDDEAGIALISASQRRNSPQTVDSKVRFHWLRHVLPERRNSSRGGT